jgi:hypothetical protein
MSEGVEAQELSRASTRRTRRFSVIWLVPIIAVAIGAWLAWDTLSKEGPTITISFETAEGLQAGQSQLKFRDIAVGTVKNLALSPDHSHVLVTIATTKQAEPLLTGDTQFWVVKPRLFAGNVSGLSTLVSGSYIGMLPGQVDGPHKRDFVGREDPPVLVSNVPGRTFLLKATRLGSLTLGSPVFFRDLSVGEVLAHLSHTEGHCYRARLDRFMAEPRPEFEPDDAQFHLERYRDADPEDEFDHFEEQRETNVEFLRNLPAGAGDRVAIHQAVGPITMTQMLHEWAMHDLGHVRQVAELVRARKYLAGAGPLGGSYELKP